MAQKLLKQQLERHLLVVTATSNGNEAVQGLNLISELKKRGPADFEFIQNGSHTSPATSVLLSLTIVSAILIS